MAQIGGEMRQQLLDVPALPIPAQQPGHGKSVSKIVQPRLATTALRTCDPCTLPDELEGVFRSLEKDPTPVAIDYEGTILRGGPPAITRIMFAAVSEQDSVKVHANRDESAFVKLRVADSQDPLVQIHVIGVEPQGLSGPKARAIQQEQECSGSVGLHQPGLVISLFRSAQQGAHVVA
jgi:hypothetical protein